MIKNNKMRKWAFIILIGICIVTVAGIALLGNDSDEYLQEQWYLHELSELKYKRQDSVIATGLIDKINEVRSGSDSVKSEDTVVAVIDTQIDWSHEDLVEKAWLNEGEIENDGKDNDNNGFVDDRFGYNFLKASGVMTQRTKDSGAHGTAIAGVLCANMNNKKGIVGIVGNARVKVMNLVVLDSYTTQGNIDNLVEAIKYADRNGADICNISSNYAEASEELYNTIQRSKMLFVVSAGNRPTLGVSIDKVLNIPAMYNFQNVITVSAFTQKHRMLRQANFGSDTVDIAAPGDEILAPIPGNQYAYFSGSSISTPMVTGLAALLDQASKEATAEELRKQVISLSVKTDVFKKKIRDGALLQLPLLLFD